MIIYLIFASKINIQYGINSDSSISYVIPAQVHIWIVLCGSKALSYWLMAYRNWMFTPEDLANARMSVNEAGAKRIRALIEEDKVWY